MRAPHAALRADTYSAQKRRDGGVSRNAANTCVSALPHRRSTATRPAGGPGQKRCGAAMPWCWRLRKGSDRAKNSGEGQIMLIWSLKVKIVILSPEELAARHDATTCAPPPRNRTATRHASDPGHRPSAREIAEM